MNKNGADVPGKVKNTPQGFIILEDLSSGQEGQPFRRLSSPD